MGNPSLVVRRFFWLGLAGLFAMGCGGTPAGPNGDSQDASDQQQSVPPALCSDAALEKAFRRGEAVGKLFVQVVWGAFGCCNKVDQFVDRFMTRIQEIAPEIDADRVRRRCRYAGVIEGIFAELEKIQQDCETKCFMDGKFIGIIEAKAYCDLVIDTGGDLDPEPWIRTPVATCGFEFETGCDTAFLGTTQTYANTDGACEPYTRDPYFEVWDRCRLRSCDYSNRG